MIASSVAWHKRDMIGSPIHIVVQLIADRPIGCDELIVGGGRLEYHCHNTYNQIDAVRDALIRLVGRPDEPYYWRMCMGRADYIRAINRTLLPSTNHVDGQSEPGVSVSRHRGLSITGYRYGYQVDGNICGYGSDGEPCLDPETITVMSGLRTVAAINNEHIRRTKKYVQRRARELNWPAEAIYAALQGQIIFCK